jgi:hypothetical protein
MEKAAGQLLSAVPILSAPRVPRDLGRWTVLTDAVLRQAIGNLAKLS